jgi:hypothetical protein
MTLQVLHSEFPYICGKSNFLFISVQIVKFAAYAQDDPRFGHDYDGYGYGGTPPPDYASANPVGNDEVKQILKYFCIPLSMFAPIKKK